MMKAAIAFLTFCAVVHISWQASILVDSDSNTQNNSTTDCPLSATVQCLSDTQYEACVTVDGVVEVITRDCPLTSSCDASKLSNITIVPLVDLLANLVICVPLGIIIGK